MSEKRINKGFRDNEWELPSGHLESNETLIEAAKRESYEEINLKPIKLKFVHLSHRKNDSQSINFINENYIDVFYKVISYNHEEKIFNKEPDRCNEIKWFDINNLPTDIISYTKNGLESMKNNIIYSEFGW